MFSLIEFKYKPTAISTPPTRNRINGGHILSGNISVMSLGRLIIRPSPPIKNITCSAS